MTPAQRVEAMIEGLRAVGLSNDQIAARAHVSRATVYRGANGEVKAPSFETYERIERLVRSVGLPPPDRVGHR